MGSALASACSQCCGDEAHEWPSAGAPSRDLVVPAGRVDPLSEFATCPPAGIREEEEAAAAASLLAAGREPVQCGGAAAPEGPVTAASAHAVTDRASSNGSSSARGSSAAGCSAASTVPDAADERLLVERFVRGLVKGTTISVVSALGDPVECILSIDREITTLSLQRAAKKSGKKREIPLKEIHKACSGAEVAGEDCELPLDGDCVALLLEDGQMLGFRAPEEEGLSAGAFTRCLAMLVQGQTSEVRLKRPKKVAGASPTASFVLEDGDNVSLPDCQESPAPFEFLIQAEASE